MKEPILQNTRKLILTANKAEHVSYDEEFKRRYFDGEDWTQADFPFYLNRELRALQGNGAVTRNALQRY